MKRIIISLLALAAVLPVGAQDKIMVNDRVSLDNVKVTQLDDTVFVSFKVEADGRKFRRKEGVVLTPLVQSNELPTIVINGSRRAHTYKREQALAGRNRAPEPGLLMTVQKKRMAAGHYDVSFRVTPAMAGSMLELEEYMTTCCNQTSPTDRDMLAEPLLERAGGTKSQAQPVDVAAMVSWLEPAEEVVKQRETSLTADITYPQGVTEMRHDYGSNMLELARIDRILAPMMNDDVYDIKNVRIDGYASIEGQWDTNERLARDRAESFSRWLRDRYGLMRNIEVISHGEDWEGLLKMVEEDPGMPSRSRVMAIIEGVGIFNGREKQLMDLDEGVPYRYMYRHFFPRLRRMVITFNYEVGSLDGDNARRVMESRPGDLSHAEMLRTMSAQGSDRLAMYRTLAAQHPSDPVALINASSAELVAGNIDTAWGYLQHVQNDPRAANNIKIYRTLMENAKNADVGPYRYKIATE